MAPKTNVYLFGDQVVDIHASLQELYRLSKRYIFLSLLLQSSTDILQSEVATLAPSERLYFSFSTLLDLSQSHSHGSHGHSGVTTVLLSVVQLGWLLVQADQDHEILDGSTPKVLVGLCTGVLPAIAAAFANGVTELLKLAPEIIRISLRLGLSASRRAQNLEQGLGSWASIVSGVPSDELRTELQQLHESHKIALHRQAYISVAGASSITVSGPPSTLQHLFEMRARLPHARWYPLPLTAAYHASHLDECNIDEIIGTSPILDRHVASIVPIISTSSGEVISGNGGIREVLRRALDDILQLPIEWSLIIETLTSFSKDMDVTLSAIGPTNAISSLERALRPILVRNIAGATSKDQVFHLLEHRHASGDIAIVGLSVRFPGAESPNEFWHVLENGLDLHKEVPADRFDVKTHCDPSGQKRNTTTTPYGCFLDHPDQFDARLFNMSPREAAQTDPIHRLLLMTAYEALEMSGYSFDRTPATHHSKIGTYFGQSSDDWREVNASQDIDTFHITGGIRAFGPGRINYHFGWEGPSFSIDTACSGSSAAIHLACSALISRQCDTALAGGANIMTASDLFAGLSRGGFLSPTGSCKTWDESADGYCRADGVGTIVLKRLEDAIADRDNIQAVIKSIATNHSANATSITHPHAETQQKLLRQVLEEASLTPGDIDYVEMHGTGTQAGDVTECLSVMNVFGENRKRDHQLYIGTIKPNLGHSEAASGVASVIKASMMFRTNIIPPHVGIKNSMNNNLTPLSSHNIEVSKVRMPFTANPDGDGKKRIVVNNFNATGGNTSLIIESPPEQHTIGQDLRTSYAVAVSARTPNSFRQNIQRLVSYLIKHPQIKLSDLSYTTTARRMHHVFRKAHAATSICEVVQLFKKDLVNTDEPKRINKAPTVVFVFTGQASQYSGMGLQLFRTCRVFRDSLATSDSICRKLGFPSFLDLITKSDLDIAECSPILSQLALVALEVALATLWQSWGFRPDAVVGHSLGEYSALVIAGVLSVTDMLFLVGQRALLLEEKCTIGTHAMLAVSLSSESLYQIFSELPFSSCEIACFNSPNQTVVGGTVKDIKALIQHLKENGVKCTLLCTPYAFHSAQIDPVLQGFEATAQRVHYGAPTVPVISTATGTVVQEPGVFGAQYLAQQARNPVNFVKAVEESQSIKMINERTIWVEIGPERSCSTMVQTILGLPSERTLHSLSRREENWPTLSKNVVKGYEYGINVDWSEYSREYEDALSLLELPSYAFDLKSYWLQYQGDWSIQKGVSYPTMQAPQSAPPFSTSTLHIIESEDFSKERASVSFASDLEEEKLRGAILGHMVNNCGLCPSSIYADMALTAASYIWNHTEHSTQIPAMDVSGMKVFKPLLLNDSGAKQLVRLKAVRDKGCPTVEISLSSQLGTEVTDHATCSVIYGHGKEWMSQWAMSAYLIQSRIKALMLPDNAGKIHRILRDIVYQLFSTLVKYDRKYQGIEEAFMDSEMLEATARIHFQTTTEDGKFTYNPYWIDSLAHLSGFVLNGNCRMPEDVVYISHGWDSMRFAKPLAQDKCYQTYVRMQPAGPRGVMSGSVYVLEDDEVVALFSGVLFQSIKKKVLRTLLPGNVVVPTINEPMPPSIVVSASLKDETSPSVRNDISFSHIISCIAGEIGVDPSELIESADLADLGVDSLLTMSILDTLRKQLAYDIPSSLFATHPTVGDLRRYFERAFLDERPAASSIESYSVSSDEKSQTSPSQPTTIATSPSEPEDVATVFRNVIASELEIAVSEIEPGVEFADLGVDSLLSLSILNTLKSRIGQNLPSTFFHDHPTFADIQASFSRPSRTTAKPEKPLNAQSSAPKCTSVLLRGQLKPGRPILFLFPDGSGSASSYVNIPNLGVEVAVIALNSPFVGNPLDFNIPLEAVAQSYFYEILKHQPEGPYLLGGWSIGGTYAYDIAKHLLLTGTKVAGLILIDAPCPETMPPLPLETVDLLEQIGTFDSIKRNGPSVPANVRQHFVASLEALKKYHPLLLGPLKTSPPCVAIWARNGVWESVPEQKRMTLMGKKERVENKAQEWIMEPRKDFGANGWEKLVPGIECKVVDGDHFSIMRMPKVKALGQVIGTVVERFLQSA